ncbi:MAG: hypothetical protein PHS50_15090, partial [Kiritimatiellae bacterium]|nr:hypothetical protein [Kiritimatiellia bacterium]
FEIIDGRPVIYSLGNFVFDQFFSQETQEGLVLAGAITKEKIAFVYGGRAHGGALRARWP